MTKKRAWSAQAHELISEYERRVVPYEPQKVVDVLRQRDEHILADLFESLTDQVMMLQEQVLRLQKRTTMKRPAPRKPPQRRKPNESA